MSVNLTTYWEVVVERDMLQALVDGLQEELKSARAEADDLHAQLTLRDEDYHHALEEIRRLKEEEEP